MSKPTLTPDVIGESLGTFRSAPGFYIEGRDDDASFTVDHQGNGEIRVTLWEYDEQKGYDVEVGATRSFRIVEVTS